MDISGAFAYVSAPKDTTELGLVKKACQITCTVFSKHVKKEIVTIVDVEKKVKHSKLAEEIETAIIDGKYSPPGSTDDIVSPSTVFEISTYTVHVRIYTYSDQCYSRMLWQILRL